jgi:cobalamin biosynthesis protein CbiG
VGVVSVSEAAALRAGGGELILPKVKGANATLAVARVA